MKYHYNLTTIDGAQVAHVTKGTVDAIGPVPALTEAMRESFETLTAHRPTFEGNGHKACAGPFRVESAKLELLER